MAANPIHIRPVTMAVTLAVIIGVELLAGWLLGGTALPRYAKVGVVRLLQIGGMLAAVVRLEGGLAAIGWHPRAWLAGVARGLRWSLMFALAAGFGMALLYLAGQNPIALIRSSLPTRPLDLVLLFVVGGLIAPIAEEICFRGVLFSFFRSYGIVAAIVFSTAIFVVLHFNRLPATQVVGGIVFALSYETSRNLMVPITIHALGNLALFALSLPLFQH
jgi:membrane protease YdiL (CAAX protease family)